MAGEIFMLREYLLQEQQSDAHVAEAKTKQAAQKAEEYYLFVNT